MVDIISEIREHALKEEKKVLIKETRKKMKYILKNTINVDKDDIEKIEYIYKKVSRNKSINDINSREERNYLLSMDELIKKSDKINNIILELSDFLKEKNISIATLNSTELMELLHDESNKILDTIDLELKSVNNKIV